MNRKLFFSRLFSIIQLIIFINVWNITFPEKMFINATELSSSTYNNENKAKPSFKVHYPNVCSD